MRKHNITDFRDIKENEDVLSKYDLEFNNSPLNEIDSEEYAFFLPEDLMEQLSSKVKNGVVLVGGGRNECLKEVALLLRVLDIKFSICEDLTY